MNFLFTSISFIFFFTWKSFLPLTVKRCNDLAACACISTVVFVVLSVLTWRFDCVCAGLNARHSRLRCLLSTGHVCLCLMCYLQLAASAFHSWISDLSLYRHICHNQAGKIAELVTRERHTLTGIYAQYAFTIAAVIMTAQPPTIC